MSESDRKAADELRLRKRGMGSEKTEKRPDGAIRFTSTAAFAAVPAGSVETMLGMSDKINHPRHYTSHPANIECITVVEHFGFNIGNAVKYLWRAGLKEDLIEDLLKARWYVDREIARLGSKR